MSERRPEDEVSFDGVVDESEIASVEPVEGKMSLLVHVNDDGTVELRIIDLEPAAVRRLFNPDYADLIDHAIFETARAQAGHPVEGLNTNPNE